MKLTSRIATAGFLLLATGICGCAGWGAHEPDQYFVLEAAAGHRPAVTGVQVGPTTAAAFYDTQDIVFSRSTGTRAYYRYHHWTERPQRAVRAMLLERFDSTGRPPRFEIETSVEEIYHDAAEAPGTARITVNAQLVDLATREIVARRTFTAAAPASSYDAAGAVHGFSQALGLLLDDMAAWAGSRPAAGR